MINFASTKGLKLPLIAIIGIAFALSIVLGRPVAADKEPQITPPSSKYEDAIAGIGVVEPSSELIKIGTEISGIVREVKIKHGDIVKAGDVLFVLDQRDVDALIKTLENSLKTAKLSAEDAAAQYEIVAAIKDKRAIAKDEFSRRKYAKRIAEAKIEEINSELTQAKTTKDRLAVSAPINGKILDVNIRAGEFAQAGVLSEPLILMGNTEKINVRVEVDEENAGLINPKALAEGFVRGDTKKPIALKFLRYEPYVQPKQNLAVAGQRVDTRVLQVIYEITTTPENFHIGQQMDVFISQKN